MARSRSESPNDTPARILDVAERLLQMRGFNGFSYADVAAEVNVTKASLHYHFAGKAELGAALIARYSERFATALARIDQSGGDARAKLAAYAAIYASVLGEHRMCLCGMLASDYETLPKPMQEAVVGFFEANEAWLANVLEQGAKRGQLRLAGSPREVAQAIVSGLEGAMLIARPYGDVDRFNAAALHLVKTMTDSGVSTPV